MIKDVKKNSEELERRLIEVSSYKPDLVCFPECTLTGYLYTRDDLQKFAEQFPGKGYDWVSDLAKKYSVNICFGLLESEAGEYFNTSVVIGKDGQMIHKQRKISEKFPFSVSQGILDFHFYGKIMRIVICGDLFIKGSTLTTNRDVFLQIVPMARSFDGVSPDPIRWEKGEKQEYLNAVKATGIKSAIVNALDVCDSSPAFGGAMFVNDHGELISESPHGTDRMLQFELP